MIMKYIPGEFIKIQSSRFLIPLLIVLFASCVPGLNETEKDLHKIIDSWHQAASDANPEVFFGLMDTNFIYLGTDATERWNKTEFYKFAKPYFDGGKAWDFKPYQRSMVFSSDRETAWFDELLDTWMGTCRGSGIMVCLNKEWKLVHYHLSVTISNELIEDFIGLVKNDKDLIEN